MDRKDDRRAQLARNPIAPVFPVEVAGQASRRHVVLDSGWIETLAGEGDRLGIDVRREYLQLYASARLRDLVEHEHADGIGLLAGAAARRPNPDGPVRRVRPHQLRNDLLLQTFEGLGVAEEPRDVDQQIVGETLEFRRVLSETLEIAAALLDTVQGHAPLDPALQRAVLVQGEIVRRSLAEQFDNLRE